MDRDGRRVVVCDNGTGVSRPRVISDECDVDLKFAFKFVKCGFAGSNFPEHIFPSLVGRPILRSSTRIGDIEVKVGVRLNFPDSSFVLVEVVLSLTCVPCKSRKDEGMKMTSWCHLRLKDEFLTA